MEDMDVEKTWNEFWKEIVTDKDGNLDLEQIKKELTDYSFVMEQVSKVYDHITGGLLSKPHYYAETVIAKSDDYTSELVQEGIEDELGAMKQGKV